MKRLEVALHDLLVPHIDRFIPEIGELDQSSAQWTLVILFGKLKPDMTLLQREKALALLKRNLADHDDWIVLDTTIDVSARWPTGDTELTEWISPHFQ